jgi:hypothetical protein
MTQTQNLTHDCLVFTLEENKKDVRTAMLLHLDLPTDKMMLADKTLLRTKFAGDHNDLYLAMIPRSNLQAQRIEVGRTLESIENRLAKGNQIADLPQVVSI